jgi:hypothetical protein
MVAGTVAGSQTKLSHASTSTPRVKAIRRRQSWGLHRRSIDGTETQLGALEVRGYPDRSTRQPRRRVRRDRDVARGFAE